MNLRIGIIIGSTRPERKSPQVAKWLKENAKADSVEFELIDLLEYDLPNLGQPALNHSKWAEKIKSLDGFIFVTPEYNHSIPGALKNALDHLREEWGNKAAAIVSFGAVGGVRAAEHLRLILAELKVADVKSNLAFSMYSDFEAFANFTPNNALRVPELNEMLSQLTQWSRALKPLRG